MQNSSLVGYLQWFGPLFYILSGSRYSCLGHRDRHKDDDAKRSSSSAAATRARLANSRASGSDRLEPGGPFGMGPWLMGPCFEGGL